MDDTTVSIIGILIGAILMFIAPLIMIADRTDDLSQLSVQTFTTSFVDGIIKTGKITSDSYQDYISALNSTGNTYDVNIEIKVLDKNTAQKYTVNSPNGELGPNTYYSIFTTQIEDRLSKSDEEDDGILNETGKIILKEGDIISVTAKNSSKTISQSLKSVYYTIKGDDLHIIAATGTGTIAINGAT